MDLSLMKQVDWLWEGRKVLEEKVSRTGAPLGVKGPHPAGLPSSSAFLLTVPGKAVALDRGPPKSAEPVTSLPFPSWLSVSQRLLGDCCNADRQTTLLGRPEAPGVAYLAFRQGRATEPIKGVQTPGNCLVLTGTSGNLG